MSLSVDELQDLLPLYYKRLFPFGPFYRWLTYGAANSIYFSNREFSLTLNNDVYIRYQSYDNQDELEKEIKKHCPCKIDIGAVYTTRPRDNRMSNTFSPVEKELVFDVDMTDYDEVRTCCSGAEICIKCWKFLAIACKVINEALQQDFGWKHMLWVFSGRRGIHCWVCDESARKLDSSSRSAVAEYLQIITGGQNQSKKVSLQGDILHPLVSRSLKMLEKHFIDICIIEQDILGTQELCNKFLLLINDMDLRENVRCKFEGCTNSSDRWSEFVNLVDTNQGQMGRNRKNKYLVEEVILQCAYPRLDINVTKGINHLLKSPFCIHPKTGKVCVPFLCRNVDNFDPNNVPTITSLINEINKYDREIQEFNSKCEVNVKDYKKTSLNKYMHVFQEFLSQLQESSRESRLRNSDMKMEF